MKLFTGQRSGVSPPVREHLCLRLLRQGVERLRTGKLTNAARLHDRGIVVVFRADDDRKILLVDCDTVAGEIANLSPVA